MHEKPRKFLSLSLSLPEFPVLPCRVFAFSGPAKFVAFILMGYALGGDACNGRSENGVLFLGNHGQYTQVNELTFWLSYFHGVSVLLGTFAAVVSGWWLERQRDPIYSRWMGPVGKIVASVGIAGGVALGFNLRPLIVIPILLLLAVGAFIIYAREREDPTGREHGGE